jgi:hypothetical protein
MFRVRHQEVGCIYLAKGTSTCKMTVRGPGSLTVILEFLKCAYGGQKLFSTSGQVMT